MGGNEDAIRINLHVVPSKGHGDSLYVVGSSSNELTVIDLNEGERVRWRERSYPYTAFLRNRNLQKTPRSCRGLICVFRCNPKEDYRLGVIGNLSPLWNRTVHIYEWTGSSIVLDGVFTPEFIYFANKFPVHYETVSSDFTTVKIDLKDDEVADIFFVNIVSSHPNVDLPKKDCVNKEDGCFEMSPKGPDKVIDPDTMPKYENASHPVWSEWDVNLFNPLKHLNEGLSREKTPSLMFENAKGIHHLPSEVYAVVSEGVPTMRKGVQERIQGLLAVPIMDLSFVATDPVRMETYVGKGQCLRFAFITRKHWKALVKKGELPHNEHNAYLAANAEAVISLSVLKLRDDMSGGIRLCIGSKAEMETVKRKKRVSLSGTEAYHMEDFVHPNENCPGNVVVRVVKQRKVSRICAYTNVPSASNTQLN